MRPHAAAVVSVIAGLTLVGCGGGSSEIATSSSAPPPSASAPATSADPALTSSQPTPTPTPTPAGERFTDVVEAALASYAELTGRSPEETDLAGVLGLFDADVPLLDGLTISGAAMKAEDDLAGSYYMEQVLGFDAALSKSDLEAFGDAAPDGWSFNSISTTDTSSSLVMTRETDDLRIVLRITPKPKEGEAATAFILEQRVTQLPEPAWLATLPAPEGGSLIAVGEGLGSAEINYNAARGGLVTATWRYPVDQLEALQEFIASPTLEEAGFTTVDPDSIVFGSSYIEVTAGEWVGEVIVGESIIGDTSYADLVWRLTRP